jgi:hypothetical protein
MENQMLRKFSLIGAVAAALFFPIPASAGSAFKGAATNPGGKYVPYGGGVGKFHTNPGGKYVYRGYGSKFHTNPGGKYVYPGWSAK